VYQSAAYVKLCIVDLVRHCVDSNFSWSIKSNRIISNRLYSEFRTQWYNSHNRVWYFYTIQRNNER